MALPTVAAAKSSITWRVFRFFVVVWGVQALWVWATHGTILAPDAWASWWIGRMSDVVRWVDATFTNGVSS